ncbi:MAG: NTP transferase domain-containing protein [Bacteroidales bacterium]|nr:NTP transferase domain-containing protein [Bacteroidales bacterium]
MNLQKKKCSVIILAAGNSGRMGEPKSLLKWDENETFIQKIIDEYKKFGCESIVVVVNNTVIDLYEKYSYKFFNEITLVINNHLEWDRFYSVKLGLNALKDKQFCFIQNVDNPFVSQELLQSLFADKDPFSYNAPYYKDKGGHPILINKKIINSIVNTSENDLNLKNVLSLFNKNKIAVNDKTILYNINNKQEYNRLFKK